MPRRGRGRAGGNGGSSRVTHPSDEVDSGHLELVPAPIDLAEDDYDQQATGNHPETAELLQNLQAENEESMRKVKEDNDKLMEKLVTEHHEMMEKLQEEHVESMRKVKEEYEKSMSQVKREHTESMTGVINGHREAMANATVQHGTSIATLKEDHHSSMKTLTEKYTAAMDQVTNEVQTLRNQLAERKRPGCNCAEVPEKRAREQEPAANAPAPEPIPSKRFVLKFQVASFEDVSDGRSNSSSAEDHFGCYWSMFTFLRNRRLGVCVELSTGRRTEWSMQVDFIMTATRPNGEVLSTKSGGYTLDNSAYKFACHEVLGDHQEEGNQRVDIHIEVRIVKMTGFYASTRIRFDETAQEMSDVVLVVQDQKFYVAKMSLARHSPYFKGMLLGQFPDANKPEITLSGVDPADFQKFLETLDGEFVVDDWNVEALLMLADMYDTELVRRRCIWFIRNQSRKSMKHKLDLTLRFDLDQLQDQLIDRIHTIDQMSQASPRDLQDMDHGIMLRLYAKVLNNHRHLR